MHRMQIGTTVQHYIVVPTWHNQGCRKRKDIEQHHMH